MKEIKTILFVHRVDKPFNPLFEAILREAALSDSVLSTAGLCIESAEIGFPDDDLIEGNLMLPEIKSTLESLGFQSYYYSSKNIRLHPELIEWADAIFVPDLGVEDLLCLFYHNAWSKTIPMEDPSSSNKYLNYNVSFYDKDDNNVNYSSVAMAFKAFLPDIIDRVKDSFANHLVVKGRVLGKDGVTIIGNATVIRHKSDLANFTPGNILVADRLGAILVEVGDNISMKEAAMNAKAVVCSRGLGWAVFNVPYLYYCVGATERIRNNQIIIVDSTRGEVYDAVSLQGC